MFTNIVVGISTIIISFFISSEFFHKKKLFNFEKKKKTAEEIIKKSEDEKLEILGETKVRLEKNKENLKEEMLKKEARFKKQEENLDNKDEKIRRNIQRNNSIKLNLATYKEGIQSKEEDTKRMKAEVINKLSEKTGVSIVDEKEAILNKYKVDLREENEERLARIEEDLKENAVKVAKKVLINTIQRMSSPTSVETKAVLIKVPKDHIKGKIVGKNGVNILEFEKIIDVDIIFNDLPNTISVSSYNLVNRRIAEKAIGYLIKERGEIDKTTVGKNIKAAETAVEKELLDIGRNAMKKAGLNGFNDELLKIVGRLKFRTSYGQNIMKHSLEVCWAATMMGGELGLDVDVCRVAGFLHDLGKAIDQDPDVQGAHDFLTKELMEKFKFKKEEIHAAWTHHESEKPETPEALMVMAADAISAGRPGARQESLDKYIERLQALEETARSFEGVRNTFAISAGRELRVLVDPEIINDEKMRELATNVAKKIEDSLAYPGKIKVNVIRRTRYTEIAK